MMKPRLGMPLLLAMMSAVAGAHPMGNFSVSHYARLLPSPGMLTVEYALDLAEIPTFELKAGASKDEIEILARGKMRGWVEGLRFSGGGRTLPVTIKSTQAVVTDGAGNMSVVRVSAKLTVVVPRGVDEVAFVDSNFDGRAGWKEIVVGSGADRSQALTAYPDDVSAPPQQLTVSVVVPASPVAAPRPPVAIAKVEPVLPSPVAAGGPQDKTPGAVQRGDYLSTLLSREEMPFSMALLGLGAAFVLGATHAMSPGHGKTIVAAYLVGSRGTMRHAAFLGAMVTFTHTVSVFALGLVTLFLSQYILPEKIVPWLAAISGLSIVVIGVSLFRKRLMTFLGLGHEHGHSHDHAHSHDHGEGAHHHHHVPEQITMGSLITLGVSGGLVPCPSALVLLLSAIAIGRTAYGMALLVTFSLGLALVLIAIGAAVLYAKSLIPASSRITGSKAFQLVPVLSAAVIVGVGMMMTGAALGVFKLPAFS